MSNLSSTLRADFDHYLRLAQRQEGAPLWRMFVNPRTLPVALIRSARASEQSPVSLLAPLIRLLVLWWFRVEAPKGVDIAPGLVLPHPGGIVLGSARIGANVIIFQNVTLGARSYDGAYDLSTRPVIEDDVVLGTGAVILGPVTVGKAAQVAANSLVLCDVPPGATAIGVPCEIRERK